MLELGGYPGEGALLKIKVLQLMGWGQNTSQANLLQQITDALPRREYAVTHAYLRGGTEGDGVQARASQVKYFRFSQRQRTGFRWRATAELRRFCRHEGFDVAIGHGFRAVSMLLAVNRTQRFRRCIGVAHSVSRYDSLRRRLAIRLAVRGNCRFVGVSREVTEYLLSLRAGFTPANTRTIGNAIDIEAVRKRALGRRQARAALQLPARGFVFGALGRFAPVKEHATLIHAFHQVSGERPDACLAFIGEGQLEGEYRQLVQRLGLEGRVFLLGKVQEASRYLPAYDVFVLPSRSEGLSLALMEAMAAPLPIIGSDAKGIARIIASVGETFPRGNAEALAQALRRHLTQSPAQRRAQAQRTLAYLRQNHSLAAYQESWRALIDS